MEQWSIYALYDPRDPQEYRVIGKTKNSLRTRLTGYIHGARHNRKVGRRLQPSYIWIVSLLAEGIRPGIRVIGPCNEQTWRLLECRAISRFRKLGHRLLNVPQGRQQT